MKTVRKIVIMLGECCFSREDDIAEVVKFASRGIVVPVIVIVWPASCNIRIFSGLEANDYAYSKFAIFWISSDE